MSIYLHIYIHIYIHLFINIYISGCNSLIFFIYFWRGPGCDQRGHLRSPLSCLLIMYVFLCVPYSPTLFPTPNVRCVTLSFLVCCFFLQRVRTKPSTQVHRVLLSILHLVVSLPYSPTPFRTPDIRVHPLSPCLLFLFFRGPSCARRSHLRSLSRFIYYYLFSSLRVISVLCPLSNLLFQPFVSVLRFVLCFQRVKLRLTRPSSVRSLPRFFFFFFTVFLWVPYLPPPA